MIGGRLTLAFLGAIGAVVGVSALAYWRWAHHRPLVVVLGAVAVVLVLMEAAYRRWEQTDRALQAARIEPDRVALLMEACRGGKRVQVQLVYLSDENARFDAVCEWAKATWVMLAEHFPHYSQEFYGPHNEALREAMFSISCLTEIKALNGYVERYVEKKLTLLYDLLSRYDAPRSGPKPSLV
jgi:hypothetical protein